MLVVHGSSECQGEFWVMAAHSGDVDDSSSPLGGHAGLMEGHRLGAPDRFHRGGRFDRETIAGSIRQPRKVSGSQGQILSARP